MNGKNGKNEWSLNKSNNEIFPVGFFQLEMKMIQEVTVTMEKLKKLISNPKIVLRLSRVTKNIAQFFIVVSTGTLDALSIDACMQGKFHCKAENYMP